MQNSNLAPTSTIGIEKEGNNYRPLADLSGELTIQWSPNSANKPGNGTNNVSGINLPEVSFEHLVIQGGSQPSIGIEYVALDNYNNDQAVLARFPLSLNQLVVTPIGGNQVALQLDLDLTLTPGGNGISAGTTFSILGDFSNGYYDYNSTQLNSIELDVDLGVAHIAGSIDIYNQDAIYGDGFRGELSAHINAINLGFDATMQIGKTLGNNGYRYWYFDLLFNMGPTGLPIPGTAAAIYSIGGGAYHNMYRDPMPQDMVFDTFVDDPPYNDNPGSTVYGNDIVPQEGSFGFNASMGFGLVGSPNALNGDVKFSMQLTENGGINNVMIEGGGYMMQSFGDRSDAFISGSLAITIVPHNPAYPNTTPMFHLDTPDPFSVNVADVLSAEFPLGLHFDPQTWYVKIGEWQNWQEPWNDGSRAQMGVDLKLYETMFHGYFMMGNDIPGIPPLPLEVQQKFGMNETTATPRSGILGVNNSGGGIAFGAGYRLEIGDPRLKFLIFYADVDFAAGFDVTLKHYGNDTPCGDDFGIDGWYANGQMYALADFDVGMEVDVWFFEGKLSLVKVSAAATLQAALPNPNWIKGQFYINGEVLNGLIKVSTNFKFELGEKCMPGFREPF